jgi:hypothetical protein
MKILIFRVFKNGTEQNSGMIPESSLDSPFNVIYNYIDNSILYSLFKFNAHSGISARIYEDENSYIDFYCGHKDSVRMPPQ